MKQEIIDVSGDGKCLLATARQNLNYGGMPLQRAQMCHLLLMTFDHEFPKHYRVMKDRFGIFNLPDLKEWLEPYLRTTGNRFEVIGDHGVEFLEFSCEADYGVFRLAVERRW